MSLMAPEAPLSAPLSLLDRVSAWMDTPERPLSFCQILELEESAPAAEALLEAANSAKRAFACTGSVLESERWVWRPEVCFERRESVSEEDIELAISAFLVKGFSLESENPIQQLYLVSSTRRLLVTRAHHAVCDGLGLLPWLSHQLQVASGKQCPTGAPSFQEPVALKQHPKGGVRKSPSARWGGSRPLWRRSGTASPERRWTSVDVDAGSIRAVLGCSGRIRLNDVLAGACLGAMSDWNLHHGEPDSGLSLWHPVNIRKHPYEGVGNGTSRVRLYWQNSRDVAEAAASVRAQMDWAREHGEWHVPDSALLGAPAWIRRRLVCAVLRRPWVDMGSMLFSHMEHQGPHGEQLLDFAKRMDWVGMLDRRFPAGFVGATAGATTWLTLCWDPALWHSEDAEQFLELFHKRVESFLDQA